MQVKLLRWTRCVLPMLLASVCLAGCISLPSFSDRPLSAAIPISEETALGRLAKRSTPDAELTGVRLLPTGPFALDARTSLITRAERSLDLQYYILQDDATGRHILRLLSEAGTRG